MIRIGSRPNSKWGPSRSSAGAITHLYTSSIQLTKTIKPAHVGNSTAQAVTGGLMPSPASLRQSRAIEGATE